MAFAQTYHTDKDTTIIVILLLGCFLRTVIQLKCVRKCPVKWTKACVD